MEITALIAEYWLLVAALLAGGLAMGLVSGMLGIGGGGILVPVLFEIFGALGVADDVRMHMSIGTALLVMVPTTLRSFQAHKTRGSVDLKIIRSMAVPVVIGVFIGILTARYSNQTALKLVWVVSASLLSLRLFLARDSWSLGTEVPFGIGLKIYGTFIGLISTLMSIGGGVFISSMMTLYGRTIHQAVGTSSGFGPLIAIPGAIGFIWAGYGVSGLLPGSLGYVSLIGAAIVIPASVAAAPYGARMAHGISKRTLELVFATFLALIAVRFFLSLYL
jgi:uncharacterized protein